MKIYVASSWSNEDQQWVVNTLRAAGHTVYDFKNPGPGKKASPGRMSIPNGSDGIMNNL